MRTLCSSARVLCCALQVIVLLNTCGSYFSKGAAKRRLDRFLTFLQVRAAALHSSNMWADDAGHQQWQIIYPAVQLQLRLDHHGVTV